MSVLVDANILLYAKFSDFPQHRAARDWLEAALNEPDPVGIPWASLLAFLRIGTNRRVMADPLSTDQAMTQILQWAQRHNVWMPEPGQTFAEILTDIVSTTQPSGNLVSDAYLAALAREHGLTVVSTDADFGRFPGLKWINPISAAGRT